MRLFLMRHSIAAYAQPGMRDHDRSLSSEGRVRSEHAARWLSRLPERPNRIVTSSAFRTIETAALIAPALEIAASKMATSDALYGGGMSAYLEAFASCDISDNVLIIAHNPGISMVAEALTSMPCGMLPAECWCLERPDASSWELALSDGEIWQRSKHFQDLS